LDKLPIKNSPHNKSKAEKNPWWPFLFQWLEEPWLHSSTTPRIFGETCLFCSDEFIFTLKIFSSAEMMVLEEIFNSHLAG
jgi:hypothetical protein